MTAIEARGLTRSYGGVEALRGAGFSLAAGEVLALLGANGAGKSTLIQILAGALAPDAGAVEIHGQPLWGHAAAGEHAGAASVERARRLGIAVIFQDLGLYPNLSVAENIAGDLLPGWGYSPRQARRAAAEALAQLEAPLPLDRPLGELAAGNRQLAAIARALARQAQVLILDEPTAALTEREAQRLLTLLRRMAEAGRAVIFISHRLREARQVADCFLVLRDGRTVLQMPAAAIADAELHQAMFGAAEAALAVTPARPEAEMNTPAPAPPWLEAEDAGRSGGFAGVSLRLFPGEITVLAGMVGAGQSEFARALFGLRRLEQGRLRLRGRAWRPRHPRQALAEGLRYLPADRAGEGLFMPLSVAENLALGRLGRLSRHGWFPRTAAWAGSQIEAFAIRCRDQRAPVASLSGGNQQKVLLAKTLGYAGQRGPTGAPALILDEPTAGVDIAAKAELHARIRQLAANGWAVLVVSSELEETLALGDRIIIFRAGRIAAQMLRREAARSSLIAALVGASTGEEARPDATPALARQVPEPIERAAGMPLPAAAHRDAGARGMSSTAAGGALGQRLVRLARWRPRSYEAALALGLAALAAGLGLAAPRLLAPASLVLLLRNASVLAILSLGMLMVMLTGGIDISAGAMLAAASVLSAKLAQLGWPAPLALGATLAAGLALGAGNAACIAELGVPPIVATLGTMGLYRGLLLEATGGHWITRFPAWLRALGRPIFAGLDASAFAAIGVAALIAGLLRRSQPGRNLYRYGGAPAAARRWGIAEKKLLYAAYAGMGLCAALGGIFYAAQLGAAQGNAAAGYELTVIAAVVLGGADIFGGRGSVLGTLLGVLLLAMISAALILLRVPAYWQGLATGALVLAGVGAGQLRRAAEGGR